MTSSSSTTGAGGVGTGTAAAATTTSTTTGMSSVYDEEYEMNAIFRVLNEDQSNGRIRADQAEFLSYKARSLIQCLTAFRLNEGRLRDTEQILRSKLQAQSEGMMMLGDGQWDMTALMAKLTKDVAKAESDGVRCKEREAMEQAEIDKLELQKQQLQEEIEMHKQQQETVLGPRLQLLEKQNDEIQEQMERSRETLEKVKQETVTCQGVIIKDESFKERAQEEVTVLNKEMARAKSKPEHIKHQGDQIEAACLKMHSDINRVQDKIAETEQREKEIRMQLSVTERDLKLLEEQVNGKKREIEAQEKEGERVFREGEEQKMKGAELHDTLDALEMKEVHLNIELRRADDVLMVRKREEAKLLKQLQKLEAALMQANKAVPELDHMKAELVKELARNKEEEKRERDKLDEAKLELDVVIHELLSEQELQAEVKQEMLKSSKEMDEVQVIRARLMAQDVKLKRQLKEMAVERELEAHRAADAKARLRELVRLLRSTEMEEVEMERKATETQQTCQDYLGMFEQVKAERKKYEEIINKYRLMNHVLADKIAVIQSEEEILRGEADINSAELADIRAEFARVRKQKDDRRAEVNREVFVNHEKEEEIKQLETQKEKLEVQKAGFERELADLKANFELGVDLRNAVATQVVSRNSQLVGLHGDANVSENARKVGDVQLCRLEEEVRVLDIVLKDTERELVLAKRAVREDVPAKVKQIEEMRQQLARERTVALDLAAKLESPEKSKERWAVLMTGVDPSMEELQEKLAGMEKKSADCEKQMRAREVLLEELNKKQAMLTAQRNNNKETTAQTLEKVNELRVKLNKVDQKIVATLAELSLFRAHAMQLSQVTSDLSKAVAEAQAREAEGKAPTVEAEREWYNMEVRRQLKIKEEEDQREKDDKTNTTMWGEKTAAPRRYASYIPDDGMGLPKAFGSHAPFLPSSTIGPSRFFKQTSDNEKQ